MLRRPRILLIGGKDSAFRSISELDVDLSMLQVRHDVTPLQIEKSSELLICDELSDELAEQVALALHQARPFDLVLSFFESRLEVASRLGERLGLEHNPVAAVLQTRDKLAMRRLLEGTAIPTVRFAECNSLADLEAFVGGTSGPVVLKPSGGSGSRGVVRVAAGGDLAEAWEWCIAGGSLPAICEEYVDGREHSAESISRNGSHEVLMVTEKLTSGPPSFVEVGHQMPARMSPGAKLAVERIVADLLDAVGHRWGPAHTEVILTEERGPVVIETQTRFGGDQIWEMVELVTGRRLGAETVASMLDLPDLGTVAPVGKAAAIRFFANEHSTVMSVDGVEEARAVPGVVRVDTRAEPGQVLGPLKGSWSRQGYVLVVGETTDDAVELAERTQAAVRFELGQ